MTMAMAAYTMITQADDTDTDLSDDEHDRVDQGGEAKATWRIVA